MRKTVALPDGAVVPAIGQGTWHMGEVAGRAEQEINALATGIRAGMTLIDTAEMYGSGGAELVLGRAIEAVSGEISREKLFIVSKVYPHNAGRRNIFASCEASLKRLGVEYLDLYLLHWRGSIALSETVACMEELIARGKIRRWGVSNFDTDDMRELMGVKHGEHCAVNQVLYHVASRGIEYDLLPFMRERRIPVMAYCPIAQGGALNRGLLQNPTLLDIARTHNAPPAQIMLAFATRTDDVIAIPRSANPAHVLENANAAEIVLTDDALTRIDAAFPAPARKVPLEIQ